MDEKVWTDKHKILRLAMEFFFLLPNQFLFSTTKENGFEKLLT